MGGWRATPQELSPVILSYPTPFQLYQDVILTADFPAEGLCAGDVGTVVDRHVVPGIEEGFSVEFFDTTGRTTAIITVSGSC